MAWKLWTVSIMRPQLPQYTGDITVRQLQYLVAVAREQNLSAAARRCHVSQPALTEQIEKLEGRLGPLLHRGRRVTTLTPLGTLVVERAAMVMQSLTEIERVSRFPDAVRIGMIETVAPYLMPSLLAARGERIIPVQERTERLIEALDTHRIDAAILAGGTIPTHLHTVEIGTDELLLAVPADDASFPASRPEVLVGIDVAHDHEMLLLADGHCLRDQVVDVCRSANSTLGPLEAATVEMLAEMVAIGLGVTLVPAIAAAALGRNDRIRLLRLENPPRRTLYLVATRPIGADLADIAQTAGSLLAAGQPAAPSTGRTGRKPAQRTK
jgi:LysR family hydrogen peroxide-inducible transcriptional activator